MGMSFEAAAAGLFASKSCEYDDRTSRLERFILDHKPRSISEAVVMLDVVLPDMEIGGRSDGRDVKAVGRVRDLLALRANQAD